jgi:DNA-binding PadR family transcriptional regulator
VRLQNRGWIRAHWGTSENNRKAKFYEITARGAKRLASETEYWQRLTGVLGRVLAVGEAVKWWTSCGSGWRG